MEYIVTAGEMKQLDWNTIHGIGIPSMVLMERAALSVMEEIEIKQGRSWQGKKVLILAGYGNNGADGLAIARLAAEKGAYVQVVCCGKEEKASVEWKSQRRILENYPVNIGSKFDVAEYNILIDALFGVGMSRAIQGDYAQMIAYFNECSGFKTAVDLPSGIHSDNGQVMGCAIKAQLTVTFAFPKRGLLHYPGCEYAGEIVVRDIGIHMEKQDLSHTIPGMFRYTEPPIKLLPPRMEAGNKGTFGKVLLVAGSEYMEGAAVLAAKGCCRSGAGMVRVISHDNNQGILQQNIPEALTGGVEQMDKAMEWADIIAIGPGLGTGEKAEALLEAVIHKCRLTAIVDADGLNILSKREDLFREISKQGEEGRSFILTPHMGEMSRLTGCSIEELKKMPEESAIRLAGELNCVIVCKDARTLTCVTGKPVCMNTTGNSGMAAAGSGDVLTGIIAGLAAQGLAAFDAAAIGVYLHGIAGDIAARRLGKHAMMAGDIAEAMCALLV